MNDLGINWVHISADGKFPESWFGYFGKARGSHIPPQICLRKGKEGWKETLGLGRMFEKYVDVEFLKKETEHYYMTRSAPVIPFKKG